MKTKRDIKLLLWLLEENKKQYLEIGDLEQIKLLEEKIKVLNWVMK